ncbi:hypothetical protein QBC32DRAFT_25658 [Pseudoneurospora amorphoporcata]|uniref:Secreted protein n=1 Tax=Pseudoneurospora amorphoporcata TaxID=241081 RepID=A0AAN6NQ33_9PEZI|nr:hypothetical protein QBC32DRAFT_25658 [Pseudoneurospora amorphoporcata]
MFAISRVGRWGVTGTLLLRVLLFVSVSKSLQISDARVGGPEFWSNRRRLVVMDRNVRSRRRRRCLGMLGVGLSGANCPPSTLL